MSFRVQIILPFAQESSPRLLEDFGPGSTCLNGLIESGEPLQGIWREEEEEEEEEVSLADPIEARGVVWHGLDDACKHISSNGLNRHRGLLSKVGTIFRQESVEHDLLPLWGGIALIYGPEGLTNDPIDFQGVSLDDLLVLDHFSEALQRGRRRASHIVAHGTHGAFFGFALGNALLDDGGIVLLQVLAMNLLESLGSQV